MPRNVILRARGQLTSLGFLEEKKSGLSRVNSIKLTVRSASKLQKLLAKLCKIYLKVTITKVIKMGIRQQL